MITLRFYNLGPPAAADVSGDEFVFETDEVFRLPGRELIARHRSNNWLVDNVSYMRLEIRQPVVCRFQNDSTHDEHRGVFEHLSAVDGVLIADGKPFAMLKGEHWHDLAGGRAWRRFRLRARQL